MRECTIDTEPVRCPMVDTLAGGPPNKGKVIQPGDMFIYEEFDFRRIARCLGRVSAPVDGDQPALEGWVLAMVTDEALSFGFIRWVNPAKIRLIFDPPSKFAEFFFAPNLPYDADMMVRLIEYGTISERYIENLEKTVARLTQAQQQEV